MSGSPGNTSGGTQGGRSPGAQNADIVDRHHEQGGTPSTGTDASTAARGGEGQMGDPDAPGAQGAQGGNRGANPTERPGQGNGAGERGRSGS